MRYVVVVVEQGSLKHVFPFHTPAPAGAKARRMAKRIRSVDSEVVVFDVDEQLVIYDALTREAR